MKNQEIEGRIINAAKRVHSLLGTKYNKIHYQQALEREMEYKGLSYRSEFEMGSIDKENIEEKSWIDFLVEDSIILVIRVAEDLDTYEIENLNKYLKVYNKEVGLLLNFGSNSLQYKKVDNKFFKGDMNSPVFF